jgi:hypothetical protein
MYEKGEERVGLGWMDGRREREKKLMKPKFPPGCLSLKDA